MAAWRASDAAVGAADAVFSPPAVAVWSGGGIFGGGGAAMTVSVGGIAAAVGAGGALALAAVEPAGGMRGGGGAGVTASPLGGLLICGLCSDDSAGVRPARHARRANRH